LITRDSAFFSEEVCDLDQKEALYEQLPDQDLKTAWWEASLGILRFHSIWNKRLVIHYKP
jgi:hypothetical protein